MLSNLKKRKVCLQRSHGKSSLRPAALPSDPSELSVRPVDDRTATGTGTRVAVAPVASATRRLRMHRKMVLCAGRQRTGAPHGALSSETVDPPGGRTRGRAAIPSLASTIRPCRQRISAAASVSDESDLAPRCEGWCDARPVPTTRRGARPGMTQFGQGGTRCGAQPWSPPSDLGSADQP